MPPVRRLTAILAADVAGYSRLMGADEEGTHERLKAHLRELVDPKIAEHRGRVVKSTGDGFLAEFASVIDAVRCAVEVQRGMADREPEVPEERRIGFRIGVNLGDVIAEEHDIYGDGVNIAARLEALAEPGGICVSRVVRDQVRDKLDFAFEDTGEQIVKNIARPVRAYAWRPEGGAGLPTTSALTPVPMRRRRMILAPIGAAVAALLVIAMVAWEFWPATRSPSTAPPAVAATTSIAQPLVAPRLSIVVLPFTNLSNDPDQQYFADGITEDVTTDLSRIADMFVISRSTAFTYKDKPVTAKQIGRELGVRYVLEGSVQRSANHVRVSAQLIDAETDAHLWAEHWDLDMGDLVTLQNEVTGRIAVALDLELIDREAARPTEHPDALDYILRARSLWSKPEWEEKLWQIISLYEHALVIDPSSVEAQSLLAIALAVNVIGTDVLRAAPASSVIARSEILAAKALMASPGNPLAHQAKATALFVQRRYEEAIPEYETAISLDRNLWGAYGDLGICKFFTGLVDDAIPLEEQAIRLSPRDPRNRLRYLWLGRALLLQSHLDNAIAWFERARIANPKWPVPRAYLASAYALKGDTERAASELAEARRLSSRDWWSSVTGLKAAVGYWGVPEVRELFEATFFEGLRKAGMPEE
jgi:TolB-like protein/class 3 adenylate cyclase